MAIHRRPSRHGTQPRSVRVGDLLARSTHISMPKVVRVAQGLARGDSERPLPREAWTSISRSLGGSEAWSEVADVRLPVLRCHVPQGPMRQTLFCRSQPAPTLGRSTPAYACTVGCVGTTAASSSNPRPADHTALLTQSTTRMASPRCPRTVTVPCDLRCGRMERSGAMPDELTKVFAGQLARGEMILFTGAGFSLDATAADGDPIPSVKTLKKMLWPIAFPGETFEEESELGDIFACALQASRKRTAELLKSVLTVDANSVPISYATWMGMPWRRIYTLNIDDLELAVQRKYDVTAKIRSVSALREGLPNKDAELLSVHLNGTLEDIPDVTFSAFQYGNRIPGRETWYSNLAAELMANPVVFVGTTVDESPLWQHLALRGSRGSFGRELRPRSYLVSPDLPHARRAMLKNLNIEHIPLRQGEFVAEVLDKLTSEAAAGHRALTSRRSKQERTTILHRISDLRNERTKLALAGYLMGREPTWQDLTDGFAVVRQFEAELAVDPRLLEPPVILITGTAGSGKTTTLMRLCLEVQASGVDVAWLDMSADLSIHAIRRAVTESPPAVLAIDDIDQFGSQSGSFIAELIDAIPALRIFAASRGTRAERVGLLDRLSKINHKSVVVPHMTDSDIDLLLDALHRANRLGRLKGQTDLEQRKAFREHANRQLLVAMIEATSGRRFEDKVDSECRELSIDQSLMYLVLSLVTRYKAWLTSEELFLAVGGDLAQRLQDLDSLVRQQLVLESGPGHFAVRHRVIAERVVSHFRSSQKLAPAVEGLLFSLATRVRPNLSRTSREFRLLVRFLNHQFMLEDIGDLGIARSIYDRVEDLLHADAHFWLQRGSLEVEVGDLNLAENYLDQARGIAPNDHRIQTEWAYMSLKVASDDAASGRPGWRERADEAMKELRDAIQRRGRDDSYPFHVLGAQGLRYSRRAPISPDERENLLRDLIWTIDQGISLHPGADDLRSLRSDVERDYLMLAVPKATGCA
jgi:tetratricopeptide (TPR) repeat protein